MVIQNCGLVSGIIHTDRSIKMKTKLEIIEETRLAYPNKASRSGDDNGCWYYMTTPDGCTKMCAVGRCLINPKDFSNKYSNFIERYHGSLDVELKEEYRGHHIDFWRDLQYFHDSSNYFTDSGLSESGELFLKEIKKKWG